MKTLRAAVLGLVMAAAGVFLPGGPPRAAESAPAALVIRTAAGASHPFRVEVVASPEDRARGLMYRPGLAADAGMLFDFGEVQPVAMWMKNTLIPLDMLFIAADGRVVSIAERTVPHSLEPVGPAEPVRSVLEVPGGTAARLGIRAGDRIEHPLFSRR
ncbi:MAG: DUF192 domain-containing protein [Alphaproteobacteria bacterium]